jgi:PAS domain S-box-containing protein
VTGWSEGAGKLLGYSSEQILGRPAASLLAGAASDSPPSSELPRWHGTLALRHRDGHRLEARVPAHHRTPDDGTGDWLLVSAVTGLQPHPDDDALVWRSFLDSPSSGTSVFDTRLRFRRANRAGRGSLGLSEDYMRGLRLPDVVDEPESREVERWMLRALETGEPQYMELHARAPGETREHAWSNFLYRLEDPDGRVLGVAADGHDMTEQYWARKRLLLIAEAKLPRPAGGVGTGGTERRVRLTPACGSATRVRAAAPAR